MSEKLAKVIFSGEDERKKLFKSYWKKQTFFVFPPGEASANAFIFFLRVSGDEVILEVFHSDQTMLLFEAVYQAVLLLICFHELRQFYAKVFRRTMF